MRLSRNKMRPVFIFKMVDVDSDYVGSERKIDLIGRFNCIVKTSIRSKKDDAKPTNEVNESEIICELTIPKGYHFQRGYMASFDNPEKPDMIIDSIDSYTQHNICKLKSWK